MPLELDHEDDLAPTRAHKITWFAPDRPVEGTVYVLPEPTDQAQPVD